MEVRNDKNIYVLSKPQEIFRSWLDKTQQAYRVDFDVVIFVSDERWYLHCRRCHTLVVGFTPGGALPYVGGYQVPVNRPPFLRRSYTQWPPFFIQSTPNDPLFFHFYIKFYIKIANFCALRAHFEKFNDFVAILKENSQILPWNCIFAHWMTPIFGSPHQKSPPFFFWCPHRMTPFFWLNLTPNAPYFRSPVGTCTSLSYLSAPRGFTLHYVVVENMCWNCHRKKFTPISWHICFQCFVRKLRSIN